MPACFFVVRCCLPLFWLCSFHWARVMGGYASESKLGRNDWAVWIKFAKFVVEEKTGGALPQFPAQKMSNQQRSPA